MCDTRGKCPMSSSYENWKPLPSLACAPVYSCSFLIQLPVRMIGWHVRATVVFRIKAKPRVCFS